MKKLLLGLILSGIMSLHLSAMTAGDMERQIRYRIVDSTIAYNNPRWSSAAILDMENRAQEQIARAAALTINSR